MKKLTLSAIMSSVLVKGMYAMGGRGHVPSNAFGLHEGQCGDDSAAHNGGWYNDKGEKLGWGDLSYAQLQRISQEIPEGETFYVLPESASFWKFVDKIGPIGALCTTKPDINAPGIEYVQAECRWVIRRGNVTKVDDYDFEYGGHTEPFTNTRKNLTYTVISRAMLKEEQKKKEADVVEEPMPDTLPDPSTLV